MVRMESFEDSHIGSNPIPGTNNKEARMPYSSKQEQRDYQRRWLAKRRRSWFKTKCCERCGSRKRLQLDHVNPKLKVSHKIWSWSERRRDTELQKCQVLCYDCHIEKTGSGREHSKHGTAFMRRKKRCKCYLCRAEARESVRASRARIASGVRLGCGYRSDLRRKKHGKKKAS